MAQIVCKDVVLGYEGKAVVQNLNLDRKSTRLNSSH